VPCCESLVLFVPGLASPFPGMANRPSVLLLGSDMAARAAAAAAAAGGQASQNSLHQVMASSALSGSPYGHFAPGVQLARYPEVGLFSQLGQLFPKSSGAQLPGAATSAAEPPSSSRGKNGDSKNSYATRHQAAEQRRRTRINERLDRLRKIVPHAERANTAAFLEEVINYIVSLQQKVDEMEEGGGSGAARAAEREAEPEEGDDDRPVAKTGAGSKSHRKGGKGGSGHEGKGDMVKKRKPAPSSDSSDESPSKK